MGAYFIYLLGAAVFYSVESLLLSVIFKYVL
jgi:hypothetical protein